MRSRKWLAWTFGLALGGVGLTLAQKPTTAFRTIYDSLVRDLPYRQAMIAFSTAGLGDTLKSEGPFTVFVPADDAFGKLPGEISGKLLSPRERAIQNFTYHIVRGKFLAADLAGKTSLDTVQGRPLTISNDTGQVVINGNAHISKPDILCKNGVIHVVDEVLLAPKKVRVAPVVPLTDSIVFRTFVFLVVSAIVAFLAMKIRDDQKRRRPTRTGEKIK